MKLMFGFLVIFSLFATTACQKDEGETAKMSSEEIAGDLELTGSWLSPCALFDGASIKKLHKFSSDGVLEVSVVEYSDKECKNQIKQLNVGSYKYSLSNKDGNIADLDISYPNHNEYGLVSIDNKQMRLVYGTDSKATRDSINLTDINTLKAWRKIK